MNYPELYSTFVKFANLIFDFDKRLLNGQPDASFRRICDKLKSTLSDAGVIVINPLGEPYTETRTDVEANIVGEGSSMLVISEVIKPVVYATSAGTRQLLQRGVVIVSSKS